MVSAYLGSKPFMIMATTQRCTVFRATYCVWVCMWRILMKIQNLISVYGKNKGCHISQLFFFVLLSQPLISNIHSPITVHMDITSPAGSNDDLDSNGECDVGATDHTLSKAHTNYCGRTHSTRWPSFAKAFDDGLLVMPPLVTLFGFAL